MLHPGRMIIVDLRDEFIDKDEALGLFVVMLDIFANANREERFNKLIVFDEAHKYMDNPDLTGHIVDVIRQMRHQGVSVLIASQDPPSLPNAIIELSSLVILHRFNSHSMVEACTTFRDGLVRFNPCPDGSFTAWRSLHLGYQGNRNIIYSESCQNVFEAKSNSTRW